MNAPFWDDVNRHRGGLRFRQTKQNGPSGPFFFGASPSAPLPVTRAGGHRAPLPLAHCWPLDDERPGGACHHHDGGTSAERRAMAVTSRNARVGPGVRYSGVTTFGSAARAWGLCARRQPRVALERVKGIEPSYEAWEAAVLPLNYTRAARILLWSSGLSEAARFLCMCCCSPVRPASHGRWLQAKRRSHER